MKKILIAGIPGTGKTYIGDEYALKGFSHINMESFNYLVLFSVPKNKKLFKRSPELVAQELL